MTIAICIISFLTVNKMKQNDKTEFLIIGTPDQLKKVNFIKDIHICEADISSSEQARNPGIIFDKKNEFQSTN